MPANPHGDVRTITYKDYEKGDRNYLEAAKYNKKTGGKGTPGEAEAFTKRTLKAIKSGKLSPTKK